MKNVIEIPNFREVPKYINLHLPVIIKGYKGEFGECMSDWNSDTLREILSNVRVSVHVSKESNLNFVHRNFNYEYMTVSELFNRIEASQSSGCTEYLYYRSLGTRPRKDPATLSSVHQYLEDTFKIPADLHEIIGRHYNIHSTVFRIAQTGVELWTHYDALDNFLVQIKGSKQILLFPPTHLHKLNITDTSSPIMNVSKLSGVDMSLCEGVECALLSPGDVLYIPSVWSHAVTSLSGSGPLPCVCISVNIFMNDLNFEHGVKNVYGNEDPLPMKQACDIVQGNITKLAQTLPKHFQQALWSKIAAIALDKLNSLCD